VSVTYTNSLEVQEVFGALLSDPLGIFLANTTHYILGLCLEAVALSLCIVTWWSGSCGIEV